MEKKTYDKKKVKAIYDFVHKLTTKITKKTFKICEGCVVTAECGYEFTENGSIYPYVNKFTAKTSGEISKFVKAVGYGTDIHTLLSGVELDEYIDVKDETIKLNLLYKDAGMDYDDHGWIIEMVSHSDFDEVWDIIEEEQLQETVPTIYLNSSYAALIDKKNKSVKVGCQTFSIDRVRQIVEAYDKA